MKSFKRFLLPGIFMCCLFALSAQNNPVDSLRAKLNTVKEDSVRCRILTAMIELEGDDNVWPEYNAELTRICESNLKKYKKGSPPYIRYLKYMAAALNNDGYLANIQGDIPKALSDFEKSMEMETLAGNTSGIATSLNNIGSVYQYQGNIPKALAYYEKSLSIREKEKDVKGMAESYNNLGLITNEQGDVPKALEYYQKSLRIQEEIQDKDGMSISLINIGTVYEHQGDLSNALSAYEKSFKLQEELNNKSVMAGSLHNMAHIYEKQGNKQKALDYLERSFTVAEETGNVAGMAHCLNSLGSIYKKQGDVLKALNYWHKSFALWQQLNDKQGMALTSNHIAVGAMAQGQLQEAEKFAALSLKLSQEIGFPENIKDASFTLSNLYKAKGNWKGAYDMQVLFKQMSDSTTSVASRKAVLQRFFQHAYEKKVAADSIRALGERKIFDAEMKQQKLQRAALFCGTALLALFGLFMYNRFRVTEKQRRIIEAKENETQLQKQVIEEKHKEISDSIHYAERIQRSFMATKELLDENLKEYFVLFQPKDVVSGDFYWASRLSNGSFALAIADSTGHGVPGAIMSLLNITSLEKAIEKNSEPAAILDETRKNIIGRLKMDGSSEGGKDGMDCSLLVFDFSKMELKLAAAQSNIWIVRKSDTELPELIELMADKMPVGKHALDQLPFTQESFRLKKGDMIYAASDGFADQFGGAKGKKFMYKRLKELLLTIAHESPQKQKDILVHTLKEWKGDLEQVDDITIAGIRITG